MVILKATFSSIQTNVQYHLREIPTKILSHRLSYLPTLRKVTDSPRSVKVCKCHFYDKLVQENFVLEMNIE